MHGGGGHPQPVGDLDWPKTQPNPQVDDLLHQPCRGLAGLGELADEHVRVPTDKGANAGLKIASMVAGMVAGADLIDDMAVLRLGGMGKVFNHVCDPPLALAA